MTRRAGLAAVVAIAVLAGGCTSAGGGPSASPSAGATTTGSTTPEVVPSPETGPGSAQAALEKLCTIPKPKVNGGSDVPPEGPTPPAIAEVMDEVEQIRGFDFDHPVVADPVTASEIAQGYADYIDQAFPAEFYDRRSLAWQTIGVIPDGTSIRDELLEFGSTQVIGYYDTATEELKFIGKPDPSPLERITLAHELTHAIDDQRFGLQKIDALASDCRDEEFEASLGLVEGNATFFMLRWAQRFLTVQEQLEVGTEAAAQSPPPSDIAPFINDMQEWPYTTGMAFVTKLESQGGLDAVDAAFENLPVSTEQIIHPEKYPSDVPVPVDVPDVADRLGPGWSDLDVEAVGEMWLDLALALRLDRSEADTASAGWDGGIYRAWTDGTDVAVELSTAWDSDADAQEFADSMSRWIEDGDQAGVVLPIHDNGVRVLFASDAATLGSVEAAI